VGLEAQCLATLGAAKSRGKALLETTELLFRGDFRVRIPLGSIAGVDAAGDRLVVRWTGDTLTLHLGAAAARWADKIRNPPSRLDKLGVKPTSRAAVVGRLDDDFLGELTARAGDVVRGVPRARVDLLFYAANAGPDLDRLADLTARIQPDGAIWVVRPKGQAAITEGQVMAAGKAAGLVDVKVAAFSATHSAQKFVIPVSRRPAPVKPPKATAKSPRPDRSRSAPAQTRPRPAPARDRRA
jgi:hypothetical protein